MNVVKVETAPVGMKRARLPELSWNDISDPGCYLVLGMGSLARVPADAVSSGRSPLITMWSHGETRVARISDNPATPVSILRAILSGEEYYVNF